MRKILVGALTAGLAGVLAVAPAAQAAGPRRAHQLLSLQAPNTSNNWSGYNQGLLDPGGTLFNSVTGDWIVPTATQHTAGEAENSATWVGIGGGTLSAGSLLTDETLVQAGTSQDVDATGHATYSAWWEIVPVPSLNFSINISPGDHIHVDIHELVVLTGLWVITLSDVTTGQTVSQTIPYVSTRGTAEWIEETPLEIGGGSTGLAAMPNLAGTRFFNATANGANPHLTTNQALQLVSSTGGVVATPSAPNSTGDGFTVCTFSASC